MTRLSSERGLIGKGLILGLIFLAVAAVAAVDGGAIFFTKTSLTDAAQLASFDGASSYKDSNDVRTAEQAAAADAADKSAKLVDFTVNKQTGDVTVTLSKRAPTFVIQRFSFTKQWGEVKETDTSAPPP